MVIPLDRDAYAKEVSLNFGPKKRELLLGMNMSIYNYGHRFVRIQDLFEEIFVAGTNLIKQSDLTTETIMSPYYRMYSIKMLDCLFSDKDKKPNDEVKVYRFAPFRSQECACMQANLNCNECLYNFPCEVKQVPIGVFYNTEALRCSPEPHLYAIYNVNFSTEASYSRILGRSFICDTGLINNCDAYLVYGYNDLFNDCPEFADCFKLIKQRRYL